MATHLNYHGHRHTVLGEGQLGAAGSRLWVQRTLRNRHVAVLLNQIMLVIEEKQAEAKLLIRLIADIQGGEGEENEIVDDDLRRETKALAQEHLRLIEAYLLTLGRVRSQLVRVQRGMDRLLSRLRRLGRRWSAAQYRRDLQAEASFLGISLS